VHVQLLFATTALFDLDYLSPVVPPAIRANMVRALELPAVAALHKVNRRQENVAPPVALAMAANSLFGKRAHGAVPPRSD